MNMRKRPLHVAAGALLLTIGLAVTGCSSSEDPADDASAGQELEGDVDVSPEQQAFLADLIAEPKIGRAHV